MASLSSYAEIAYEDGYVAASKVDPRHRGKRGMHNREVIRAAARLGLKLEATRRYDLDDDEGILRVRWNGAKGKANPGGHFVAVKNGFVLCPSDGVPLPWRDYLDRWDARPCSLLRERTR